MDFRSLWFSAGLTAQLRYTGSTAGENINNLLPTESRKLSRTAASNGVIQWRHVPTDQNPADLGSRGGSVVNKQLWWSGPAWLKTPESCPPDITTTPSKESNAEAKMVKQVLAVSLESTDELDEMLMKYNLWKTLRICAWMARFAFNCRQPRQKLKGPLTTNEIEKQKLFWIKRAQTSTN